MTRGPYLLNSHVGCADCALAAQVEPDEKPWPLYTAGCEECRERMLKAFEALPGVDIDAVHRLREGA